MLKISTRIWGRIQMGVLSRVVMAVRAASRVSPTLPALLALAVPAVLEAQITFGPQGTPGLADSASVTFSPGSLPNSWIFTATYSVKSQCQNLVAATFLGAKNSSGQFIGTTSIFSTIPPAFSVTPQANGGVLAEFHPLVDGEAIGGRINLPAGTTQASLAVGITTNPSCSNTSLSFAIPITAGTPNLTITKTAFGAGGPITDGGTVYFGDIVKFRVAVKNEGTAATNGDVEITDQLPDWLQYRNSRHTDGTAFVDIANGVVKETVQNPIQPGQTVILDVIARVDAATAGSGSNHAIVSGGGSAGNSATVTLNHKVNYTPFPSCTTGGANLCVGPSGSGGAAAGPGPLAASAAGRFQVRVYWNAIHQGTSGLGQAVSLTSDTGYFWFFSQNNIELVIKIVDGRAVNGKFWIFYGALTNVEYIIEVVDSVTGAVQGYFNPQDTQASNADTSAFGSATTVGTESASQFIPMNISDPAAGHATTSISAPVETAVSAACVADALTQCLNGGRFQVRVHWDALHLGTSGEGQAVPITSDTGYFWFFSANNIELVIKVVDGRPVNGKFWVFYGALTNVQYTITITDTVTGAVKRYFNPQDTQASAADTSAF